MLEKYSPLEDTWRVFECAHIAGVYRVYSGSYYCSLILDPVYRVPEFMAFKWNVHAKRVTNWMEVFSFNPTMNDNGEISSVDVETFQTCMNAFYDYLIQKEAKEK